jgi:molecular chaperone DnaK (HSP70)
MTVVAIDFGTSNTIVSFLEPDTKTPKTLRFGEMSRLFPLKTKAGDAIAVPTIPTLVYVKEPGHFILGQQVRAQRLGLARPERLFKAFKRELVADFHSPPRQIDGYSYDAATISELFLKEIWQQLQAQHIYPTQLIFTVPVGAFDRYLSWFRDLTQRLGVEAVQWVDESTAAALGYAIARSGSLVLAIDFGGGTLDLSLVRTASPSSPLSVPPEPRRDDKGGQIFQAQAIAKSDAYVGGEDVDLWIARDCLRRQGLSRGAIGEVGWQNLLEIAERLKIRLSQEMHAKESWLDEETFAAYEIELSREQLENILETQQFLGQLRASLDEVLAIASSKGIAKDDIEQVLLVGGSCLIPAVQQLIISYFGKAKVKLGKPFEAVSHGALALSQVGEVEDYLRHSYAIRLWDPYIQSYSYFPLIEGGSKYPCKREEPVVLQVKTDGQTEIRLDIGEVAETSRAEVTFDAWGRMTSSQLFRQCDYHSLESHRQEVCVAHLEPPGKTGVDRIAVTFEVDEQRVLLATVRDLLTDRMLLERGAIAQLK